MTKGPLSVTAAPLIATALLIAISLAPSAARAQVGAVVNQLQNINAQLEAVVVPFKVVQSTAGLCDSAGTGTSTVELDIDSDGTEGHFVVTSILFLTVPPGVPATGFENFSINHLDVDGERFFTRSGNLFGPTDGPGVYESIDLMGVPLRRNGDNENPIAGGSFPHQIVAESDDTNDVQLSFFCSSTDDDFSFSVIQVSGWKRQPDTITVTYTPGS